MAAIFSEFAKWMFKLYKKKVKTVPPIKIVYQINSLRCTISVHYKRIHLHYGHRSLKDPLLDLRVKHVLQGISN